VVESVLLAAMAALLIWGVMIYNLLVRDRHRVDAAWSDIDVQLKRRHDLIPKIVDVVKQYAAYEQTTLTAVTELRQQSKQLRDVAAIGQSESKLADALHRLLAVAESYPELKASQQFLNLQQQISEAEDHIQYARRYYNGAVRNLNIRIDSFPDLVVARALRYTPRPYFQNDLDVAANP
jgi:LemA protein